MTTAAKKTACRRSLSLRATAGPPANEQRDGDHGDDPDRASDGHEIERKRWLDRWTRLGQFGECVDVPVVARYKQGGLGDNG
jgi:hypothetical protein